MGNGFGKRKSDITFIDPKTGAKSCSFNECYTKFNATSVEREEKVIDSDTGDTFVLEKFWHSCDQCGRKVKSAFDIEKDDISYFSYKDAARKCEIKKINKLVRGK